MTISVFFSSRLLATKRLRRGKLYLPLACSDRIIATKDSGQPTNVGSADSFVIFLKPVLHGSRIDAGAAGIDLGDRFCKKLGCPWSGGQSIPAQGSTCTCSGYSLEQFFEIAPILRRGGIKNFPFLFNILQARISLRFVRFRLVSCP
ncbi:hypothetical protein JAU75_12870 [Ochrobactrum sp. Q0168]|nr:hypothetical protein [Ochrobactrum sp. Q0168]